MVRLHNDVLNARINNMNQAITLFKDVFVPNAQGAIVTYAQWKSQQPGEYKKWVAFRDAILAAQTPDDFPVSPSMATKKGKELVAAGELAMQFFILIDLQQL
jgi:hypothetical protein